MLVMHIDASPQVHANQADDVFLRVGDKSKLQTFEERLQLNYDKENGTLKIRLCLMLR